MSARLSRATLPLARRGPWLPAPRPAAPATGVLHLGPGAFFRAHAAWYFDRALDADPRWGIAALALRSRAAIEALAPQDGLYTLVTLGEEVALRIVRAIREVLPAGSPAGRDRAFARFEDPALQLVTLTVTEKGYCLRGDGTLDFGHPDVRADLAVPGAPASAIGWLVEGLRRRRARRAGPLTLVSCDNRRDNGGRLRDAVVDLAMCRDPELAAWIAGEVAFPATMVDAITPASTDALRARVAAAIGLEDAAAVQREAFSQWVIEDRFAAARPDFAALGVTLTDDVGAFERAKLRILNGAHSTLAYLGLLRGHQTVLDAMLDPPLARHVASMLEEEVLPGLGRPLQDYVAATLARFRNRELRHELAQIAVDGSQKLPYRIVETLAGNLEAGRPVRRLAATLAAWLHWLRRVAADGGAPVDPLAPRLLALAQACTGDPAADVVRLSSLGEVIPAQVAAHPAFNAALVQAYARQPGRLGDE